MEMDDPTNLPLGVLAVNKNSRHHLTSVRTRDGIQNQYGFVLPDGEAVTGLAALKYSGNPDVQVPIAFSALGNLYKEFPVGSGTAVLISSPQVDPPENASMQAAAAYQKGYLAFTDLVNSAASPAVLNLLTGKLDPLSMKPVGVGWLNNTQYNVGEVVTPATPVGGNGHWYQCTIAGISGVAQPAFPVTEGGVIVDGAVTWKELTPVMAQAVSPPASVPAPIRNGGAGTYAAGRDVYIVFTILNAQGETAPSTPVKFVNTLLNDQVVVNSSNLWPNFLWEKALPAPYTPTGFNVYVADVATGAAAPALSSYKILAGGPYTFNNSIGINSTPGSGAAPPVVNGALIVPVGNICAGLRYMVVLFLNRNGYITGMTQASVITYNSPTNGYQLYIPHLPIGPPNTQARLCAFTPAGTLSQTAGYGISTAGPYFWIKPNIPTADFNLTNVNIFSLIPPGVTIADVVNGVQETSTLINDNVTTSATFNFDDTYLKATLNDVSAYFQKIAVPPCSDVYYSPTLKRMFYADDLLPSGWRVSLQGDPESVYDGTGIVQAAENDGTRRTAVREYQSIVYLMKERSGHVMTASTDDPNKWSVVKQWTGSGPCGPRAVDVCSSFMAYVHRSGLWIFTGTQPFRISKEVPITWGQINWTYAQTIWVMIDEESQEIRIGVPLGQSTVPNKVLRVNYEESPAFAPPIHFSPYIGKEIAAGECYKWSVDDIAANLAIRAERTLLNPPKTMDQATIQSQILYASSDADGAVSAVIPFMFDDNGVGIDWVVESVCPGDNPEGGNLLRPNQLGGVQANIDGNGQLGIEILALRAKDQKEGGPPLVGQSQATVGSVLRLPKPCQAGIPYSCAARMQNERFRLRITNDKKPGVWGDIKWACIYATPLSSARPGR